MSTRLPAWSTVLAVVAHPDDEYFGLGAILDAFHRAGTRTAVLCLTRGEASTLHGATGELTAVRGREFAAAARTLGITDTVLRDFPDGALDQVCRNRLMGEVIHAARTVGPDGLLVFDPSGVTGHPDHTAATAAALLAAAGLDLPGLGWTLPTAVAEALNRELGTGFVGHRAAEIDIVLPVNRAKRTAACAAHVSQAIPTSVLWRRLELLGDTEHLRWLSNPPAAEKLSKQKEEVDDVDVCR
ncbi:MAG TPA: PIG-L family deacetylase [Nakamurella sp.]|nr:PIG-L family deacetylase [Nakamurella sp.]